MLSRPLFDDFLHPSAHCGLSFRGSGALRNFDSELTCGLTHMLGVFSKLHHLVLSVGDFPLCGETSGIAILPFAELSLAVPSFIRHPTTITPVW